MPGWTSNGYEDLAHMEDFTPCDRPWMLPWIRKATLVADSPTFEKSLQGLSSSFSLYQVYTCARQDFQITGRIHDEDNTRKHLSNVSMYISFYIPISAEPNALDAAFEIVESC
jgi:hypothetical protein